MNTEDLLDGIMYIISNYKKYIIKMIEDIPIGLSKHDENKIIKELINEIIEQLEGNKNKPIWKHKDPDDFQLNFKK